MSDADESEADEATEADAGAKTLDDGDAVEVQGSSSMYTLSRTGDVYMCTCPAWKNQGATIDRRTCKHLRAYLGDVAETKRLGTLVASRAAGTSSGGGGRTAATKKDTAPPILLAHKWETDHDPTGWWMSEKLDGIRAYWDGEAFVSRLGNRFFAPDWFTADLPADTLDGELWVGRKMFQRTTSIVRSGAAGHEWKTVAYVVFDAPNAKGAFEDRIDHVKKVLARAEAPHARFLEHVKCDGHAHLREELQRVEALGGEGLMLRRPGSKYEIGRSTSLLKVKTFHDTEARVIGHAPGTGKHKGRLGALVCELPSGATFNVGTGFSDAEREAPPKIGAVITFRYQELSDDGVPRFPSYVGERLDVELPVKQPRASTSRPTKLEKPITPPTAGDGRPTKLDRPIAPPAPVVPSSRPTKLDKRITPGAVATRADKLDAAARTQRTPSNDPRPAKLFSPIAQPAGPGADPAPGDGLARVKRGAPDLRVRLEHPEEQKFWQIEVRGAQQITRFGKIGSTGQTRLAEVGSASAARTDAGKRAMQKRAEGYRNVPVPDDDD